MTSLQATPWRRQGVLIGPIRSRGKDKVCFYRQDFGISKTGNPDHPRNSHNQY